MPKPATPAPPHEHVAIPVETPTPSEAGTFDSDVDGAPSPAQATPVQTEGDQVAQRIAIGLVIIYGAKLCDNALILWIFVTMRSPWTDLATAAGFVDWSLVQDLRLGTSLVAATMVAGVISIYARTRPRLLLVLRATVIVVALLGFVVILAVPWSNCIPQESVDVLSLQTEAVVTYNREYCNAWCRHSDWGVAALARGECDKEKTVFDEIIDTVAVGEWCHEAIATHTFDLVAYYSDVRVPRDLQCVRVRFVGGVPTTGKWEPTTTLMTVT